MISFVISQMTTRARLFWGRVCRMKSESGGVTHLRCRGSPGSRFAYANVSSARLAPRVRVRSRLRALRVRHLRGEMPSKWGPSVVMFPQISTRPCNQNKSTTRAFPAAMTSHNPAPPPASKQKTRSKNVRVSRHSCVRCAVYAVRGEDGRSRGVPRVFSGNSGDFSRLAPGR